MLSLIYYYKSVTEVKLLWRTKQSLYVYLLSQVQQMNLSLYGVGFLHSVMYSYTSENYCLYINSMTFLGSDKSYKKLSYGTRACQLKSSEVLHRCRNEMVSGVLESLNVIR